MNQRRAVQALLIYLWRREWIGQIFTVLFAMYMGLMISQTLGGLLARDEDFSVRFYGLVDWFYLTFTPVLGLPLSKAAWGLWRDDTFSIRLAQWRTMPIPLDAIVKSRMLQSAVLLSVSAAVFILLQYGFSSGIRAAVTPGQWALIGLIWSLYAVVVLALAIWAELGLSGKMYSLLYMGYMVLTAALAILLAWRKVSVFQMVFEAVKNGNGPALAVGFAIAAGLAIWIGYRLTLRRIGTRPMAI
ncbi:hypothetical protein ACF3MZ_29785 [Paenibacillaceae bacterium WGS1546]|uniref:hypothetical protein n=1 Tax=Cohnella sp. WGS1546 TaxID=3366810 RepID=UPI00372CF56F